MGSTRTMVAQRSTHHSPFLPFTFLSTPTLESLAFSVVDVDAFFFFFVVDFFFLSWVFKLESAGVELMLSLPACEFLYHAPLEKARCRLISSVLEWSVNFKNVVWGCILFHLASSCRCPLCVSLLVFGSILYPS